MKEEISQITRFSPLEEKLHECLVKIDILENKRKDVEVSVFCEFVFF
jgi:hypothetical protein